MLTASSPGGNPLTDAEVDEITRVRGYRLQRRATRRIAAREGEALVVDEPDGADACSLVPGSTARQRCVSVSSFWYVACE